MNSFIPRLQLHTSRSSSGNDRGEQAPRLNRTQAPLNVSGPSSIGYAAPAHQYTNNSSSNHNTSMTNNTMSSDLYNASGNGGASMAGGAGPPSPAPRVSDRRFGASTGLSPHPHGWSDYPPQQQQGRYADPLASGSRSTPGPSATRPLFTSASASNPRETNVLAGDTGRVPLRGFTAGVADNQRGVDTLFASRRPPPPPPQPSVFTSTYVGTSSGDVPAGKPSYTYRGMRGGVSDADWRGGTSGVWGGPHRRDAGRESASGLVSSRSRVRADRWTDEGVSGASEVDRHYDDDDDDNDGATSLDEAGAAGDGGVSTQSSGSSLSYRGGGRQSRRPHRHRSSSRGRHHHHHHRRDNGEAEASDDDGGIGSSDVDSDDLWDEGEGEEGPADPLSFADAVVRAMDAQPVVPLEMLRKAQETPFVWIRHPSHGILLSLLQHRGIYLPRYRELVDYHMSELFLHYLDLCREGAYFVHYAPSKWPKERFFRVRMLPVNRLEAGTEPIPHLVLTLHESGVHILDAIPLDNLVGVTVSPQAACFRPFLESPNTIIGCREGRGHRARMPVDGAFSLWFYDIHQHTSRSVDVLTCDARVFDIWTKTFRGLVSVNSSSVVQVAMTAQGESSELARLTQEAREQGEIDHGERKGKYAED